MEKFSMTDKVIAIKAMKAARGTCGFRMAPGYGYSMLVVGLVLSTASSISGQSAESDAAGYNFTRGEDCVRKCDGISKNCYFSLVIERYAIMGGACRNCRKGIIEDCFLPQCVTANGHLRPFISVNRQMPGPPIQVCRGDRLTIDVVNMMPDETTSIHWHGIKQKGSQYYDGVPYVTQCPILPGDSFRYTFIAESSGTYFYHSHTAIQKFDGLTGPLIVRDSEDEETLSTLYDKDIQEHVLVVQDWTNMPGENYIPGFNGNIPQSPDAYLINGRGKYYANSSSIQLPLSEFVIEKGKRYRFRLIGSTCLTCSVSVTFQGHRLLAISADGGLKFKPIPVDTVVLNAADRFDVVLEANQTEGIYYIYAQGIYGNCNKVRQVGILRYDSIKKVDTIELPPPITYNELGVIFNAVNSTCDETNYNEVCISMLEGVDDAVQHSNSVLPYKQIPISFGFYKYNDNDLFRSGTYQHYDEPVAGQRLKALVNNVSFAFPPSTLISQFNEIPASSYCGEECFKQTVEKCCNCVNIYSISSGTVVDLIIYDTGKRGGFDHPYHLHGYNFYVLEMGVFKENREKRALEVAALSRKLQEDNLNLKLRPMRDTISIPASGYVLVRLVADNPGFWLFHCHFVFHLESGMAAVFKVGDESELPPVPPNFPKCGNF